MTSIRNLADAIGRRFRPIGGIKLRIPAREPIREPPRPADKRYNASA